MPEEHTTEQISERAIGLAPSCAERPVVETSSKHWNELEGYSLETLMAILDS